MWLPFLVLLLGLATVSSTNDTYWTKINQSLYLNCPMPDEGEKIQVCAWKTPLMKTTDVFKSSFKKSHRDRISIDQNDTNCIIRIEGIEEEDEGTWECQIRYQNNYGESVEKEDIFFLDLAKSSTKNPSLDDHIGQAMDLICSLPDDGEKIHLCSWRNGAEGAFKTSFQKSHGERIRVQHNYTDCKLRIERVEEEDKGTWECLISYQNSDGESVNIVNVAKNSILDLKETDACTIRSMEEDRDTVLNVANFSAQKPTLKDFVDENTTEFIYQNNDGESVEWKNEGVVNAANFSFENLSVEDRIVDETKPFFDFAYSVALSLSAGAGGSTTAEIGVAFGANAEFLVYTSSCLGLKADIGYEVDLSIGFWKSLDDILGHSYMLGGGVDVPVKQTDETEANVKIIKNDEGELVGGTFSLGVGEGPDLQIGWEVNLDHCYALEIWRIRFSDTFEIVWEKLRSILTKKFLKILTKIATITHE